MKRYFKIIAKILVLLLLPAATLRAQDKEIDSLIKEGNFAIYEHPDKTIMIGRQVLSSKKKNTRTNISALVMISDAYSSKRDYRKAVGHLIKAQNLANLIDDTIVKIQILTKTAVQYQQLRIYGKAIHYLDDARAFIIKYPLRDSVQSALGTNYTIRGFIYKEQLDCNIAIDYFDKGIEEYSKLKTRLRFANLSIVSYNKGNCYNLLSELPLAKKSFNDAINFAKNIDAKSLEAFGQKGLAETYTLEGNYHDAISQLNNAVKLSANVGDLVLNSGIYRDLSENYLAVNNWKDYQKFQNLYLATQSKIVASERKSVEISLTGQQKILDESLIELKRNFMMLVIALAFVLIITIFLTFRNNQKAGKTIKDLKISFQSNQ